MKNIRKVSIYLLLLILIGSIIVGCGAGKESEEALSLGEDSSEKITSDYPMEILDRFGNKATIEEEPMKIISLAPSNTEILFALELDEKIVGVTSYCDYPEEASEKQIIGSYGEFNLEKIIELEPDLVLLYGEGDEDENKILKEAGIKLLGFMPETIDEIRDDIEKIGKITAKGEKALELTSEMTS